LLHHGHGPGPLQWRGSAFDKTCTPFLLKMFPKAMA